MKDASEIAEIVAESAGKGAYTAGLFILARWRESLSVPARRKKMATRKEGRVYYKAIDPATSGAPPRKLSGFLRAHAYCEKTEDGAKVGSNVEYLPPLEDGNHPSLQPILDQYAEAILTIVGESVAS